MAEQAHYDDLETRDPAARADDLFARLPAQIAHAKASAPFFADTLAGIDPAAVTDAAALARLSVARKTAVGTRQREAPPFGGLVATPTAELAKIFTSPGPIYEPEAARPDYWRFGRTLYAAGFRAGDLVLNCFAYHLTPAGSMMEGGARAIGATVIPAGPGNTELQVDVIAHLRPTAYCGTPDFLKIVLDKADEMGRDAGSIVRAGVGGAALPPSLRTELAARGVATLQSYGTADLGLIAYESALDGEPTEGMIVDEDVLVEIVRPGTGDPVPEGEVGEVVVTSFNPDHPLIRFATGDLSAVLAGTSPCGRTNMRIKGWMGRADQTAKVRGMFVRPEQVDAIAKRIDAVGRLRLVIGRADEQDTLVLRAEAAGDDTALAETLAATLREVTKLRGQIEIVAPASLPNDGKVIEDTRPVG